MVSGRLEVKATHAPPAFMTLKLKPSVQPWISLRTKGLKSSFIELMAVSKGDIGMEMDPYRLKQSGRFCFHQA
jgi:hypothetical protein